jgi:16S rRNA (guanine527-N7)-methyltransferase
MVIGSAEWRRRIIAGAAVFKLAVDEHQARLCAVHAREMLHWNRVTNLTAITRPLDVAVKHFIDSMAAAPFVPPASRLLDVGSGAGFPGIPLKILDPSLIVTMVDSSQKKINFLKHAIQKLGLDGIEAVHCRVQDLSRQNGRPAFDVIISRALTDVRSLATMALPLLACRGRVVAMKGPGVASEWSGSKRRGRASVDIGDRWLDELVFKQVSYRLPLTDVERVLVIFERIVRTRIGGDRCQAAGKEPS